MATTSATGSGRSPEAGFTLIELMTVVLIIIFLAGLVLGAGAYMVRRSAVKAQESQILALERALGRYAADHRTYPAPLASVDLFPPDSEQEERDKPSYGLAVSALSSRYSDSGDLDYYSPAISELDVNSDGKLDDGDKFNGEFVFLDVWGYPLYYYVEEKTVGAAGVSYTARFGRWNKNGCDLGSRGPDHLPDAWESGGTWGRDAGKNDDVVNWK